ncbi:hypothetical protein FEM48_Zijuj09G0183200 [Ziziphus jujuba var. spinosa]|uniref:Plastocyanin-like domain-containing protein n=1 Tax=Ziziphus jujuba var. spinosa TaxID=714518 RepID=A0A978UUJ8_ZIZJJ|nr:hypothetical protein FEM48_Zijuj09G0183200 [Ziziphus jujuba var. spinosa]
MEFNYTGDNLPENLLTPSFGTMILVLEYNASVELILQGTNVLTKETTVGVPKNGWVAIRFETDNPGIWLLHCHIECHTTWGMNMVFLLKDGDGPTSRILPPPHDLPKC